MIKFVLEDDELVEALQLWLTKNHPEVAGKLFNVTGETRGDRIIIFLKEDPTKRKQ